MPQKKKKKKFIRTHKYYRNVVRFDWLRICLSACMASLAWWGTETHVAEAFTSDGALLCVAGPWQRFAHAWPRHLTAKSYRGVKGRRMMGLWHDNLVTKKLYASHRVTMSTHLDAEPQDEKCKRNRFPAGLLVFIIGLI